MKRLKNQPLQRDATIIVNLCHGGGCQNMLDKKGFSGILFCKEKYKMRHNLQQFYFISLYTVRYWWYYFTTLPGSGAVALAVSR